MEQGIKHPLMTAALGVVLSCAAAGAAPDGRTFFVSTGGNDVNPGTAERPFRTIQKGVDSLASGSTLIVQPGIYREAVRIGELAGTKEQPIVIKAAIPRTVFLCGSVTPAGWEKTPDREHTWSLRLPVCAGLVHERDTNLSYLEQTDISLVDGYAGSFCHDDRSGVLYIHTSDDAPPAAHVIDVSVLRNGFDGLSGGPANWHISLRKHLVIEGFVLSGYASGGIQIMRADSCEVRDCVVHHCGAGIFLASSIRSAIRNCEAGWCYDRNDNEGGGIAFRGQDFDNIIEGCTVHDIPKYSIRHYGGGFLGCVIRNCLVYRAGRVGFQTKGAYDAERKYADRFPEKASHRPMLIERNVAVEPAGDSTMLYIGRGLRYNTCGSTDPIVYQEVSAEDQATQLQFDPGKVADARFADPGNYDFRLQSDSPFVSTGKGAFPYRGEVYFVKTDGDDRAAGTSVAAAWKDLNTALKKLGPGETLYVLPGRYAVAASLTLKGAGPVSVRRRGRGRVLLSGRREQCALTVSGSGSLQLRGLEFSRYRQAVSAGPGTTLSVEQCVFTGNRTALAAAGKEIRVRDCVFTDSDAAVNTSSGISVVYGSVFHRCGRAYGGTIVPVSDFNLFWKCSPGTAGGVRHRDLAGWRTATGQDGESLTADPRFVCPSRGDYRPAAGSPARGRGYLWTAVGVGDIPVGGRTASQPAVEKAAVTLATPTTATVTWKTRGEKSTVLFRYGPGENRLDRTIERTVGQYYDSMHDLTLYDLQPSTTYYYQVGSAPRTYLFWDHVEPAGQGAGVAVWDPVTRSFTTPAAYQPKRRTFHLSAARGSDANDGLSPEKPLASLYRVSRVVEPGDRVVVGGGEYFGVLQPVNSGLPGAPIVFEAAPGERVELSGKRLTQPWSVVVLDKRHLVFRGFVFKEHSKMLQDDIGGGAQIMIGNSRDILVENCLFDGRMYYMQNAWIFQSGGIVFRDNLIYPSSNSASVIVGMNDGPVVFDHNTFMQTLGATSPVDARNNADLTFTNNIFGEKLSLKWPFAFAYLGGNRRLAMDYNYYAFMPENTDRVALAVREKPDGPEVLSKGPDPLAAARAAGLERHGKAGPPPWLDRGVIARKTPMPRGVEPRDRKFVPLEMADGALAGDAECRGMASDGHDPGLRLPR